MTLKITQNHWNCRHSISVGYTLPAVWSLAHWNWQKITRWSERLSPSMHTAETMLSGDRRGYYGDHCIATFWFIFVLFALLSHGRQDLGQYFVASYFIGYTSDTAQLSCNYSSCDDVRVAPSQLQTLIIISVASWQACRVCSRQWTYTLIISSTASSDDGCGYCV